jgi:hypothetical protein
MDCTTIALLEARVAALEERNEQLERREDVRRLRRQRRLDENQVRAVRGIVAVDRAVRSFRGPDWPHLQ